MRDTSVYTEVSQERKSKLLSEGYEGGEYTAHFPAHSWQHILLFSHINMYVFFYVQVS